MPPIQWHAPDTPLFVWESGDLRAFASVADAEAALEPTDVKDGIYRGFDAAGRLLRLGATVRRQRLLGLLTVKRERVEVSLAEDEPLHRAELDEVLVRFLRATGADPGIVERMSHEEKVAEANRVSRAIR